MNYIKLPKNGAEPAIWGGGEGSEGEPRRSRDMVGQSPTGFRENPHFQAIWGAYVKKSMVMCGGKTGLAAPWTAGSSPLSIPQNRPARKPFREKKFFKNFVQLSIDFFVKIIYNKLGAGAAAGAPPKE